jgi:3-ketosteroid 9alpha-monooxygenase subunit A
MATTADYGLGPHAYPRGWFMIAVAADVTPTPQAVHFFGKEMVLYRGKGSGRPILLDAYCPHMRVHLARNTTSYIVRDGMQVEGDSIRCPAHGWRYNSRAVRRHSLFDPRHSQVGVPEVLHRGRARRLHLHVARHGRRRARLDLPVLSEWDRTEEGWVRWTPDHLGTLPIHPQEILDNMTDIAHFAPVHGSTGIVYFENVYAARSCASASVRATARWSTARAARDDTWYTGPGILLCRMEGKHPSLMMICNTPVKDGEVRVWFAVMAKTADNHAPTRAGSGHRPRLSQIRPCRFRAGLRAVAAQGGSDQRAAGPDDGPFHKGRIWYRQFFHPREQAGEFQNRVNGSHVTLRGKGEVMQVA